MIDLKEILKLYKEFNSTSSQTLPFPKKKIIGKIINDRITQSGLFENCNGDYLIEVPTVKTTSGYNKYVSRLPELDNNYLKDTPWSAVANIEIRHFSKLNIDGYFKNNFDLMMLELLLMSRLETTIANPSKLKLVARLSMNIGRNNLIKLMDNYCLMMGNVLYYKNDIKPKIIEDCGVYYNIYNYTEYWNPEVYVVTKANKKSFIYKNTIHVSNGENIDLFLKGILHDHRQKQISFHFKDLSLFDWEYMNFGICIKPLSLQPTILLPIKLTKPFFSYISDYPEMEDDSYKHNKYRILNTVGDGYCSVNAIFQNIGHNLSKQEKDFLYSLFGYAEGYWLEVCDIISLCGLMNINVAVYFSKNWYTRKYNSINDNVYIINTNESHYSTLSTDPSGTTLPVTNVTAITHNKTERVDPKSVLLNTIIEEGRKIDDSVKRDKDSSIIPQTFEGNILDLLGVAPVAHCVSRDHKMSAGLAKHITGMTGRSLQSNNGKFSTIKYKNSIVYNIITKELYYQKPTYDTFTESFKSLINGTRDKMIFIPERLSCGLDGLDWELIKNKISRLNMEGRVYIIKENRNVSKQDLYYNINAATNGLLGKMKEDSEGSEINTDNGQSEDLMGLKPEIIDKKILNKEPQLYSNDDDFIRVEKSGDPLDLYNYNNSDIDEMVGYIHLLNTQDLQITAVDLAVLSMNLTNLSYSVNRYLDNYNDNTIQPKLRYLCSNLFKLRHNIFGAYCRLDAFLTKTLLDTDCDLKQTYDIDINMTPDYIMDNDNKIIIYEYSVTNSLDKTLLQKGGMNLEKYEEVQQKLKTMFPNKTVTKELLYFDTTTLTTNYSWVKLNFDEIKGYMAGLSESLLNKGVYAFDDQDESHLNSWMKNNCDSMIQQLLKKRGVKLDTPYNKSNITMTSYLPQGFIMCYNNSKEKMLRKLNTFISLKDNEKRSLFFNNQEVLIISDHMGIRPRKLSNLIRDDNMFSLKNIIYIPGTGSKLKNKDKYIPEPSGDKFTQEIKKTFETVDCDGLEWHSATNIMFEPKDPVLFPLKDVKIAEAEYLDLLYNLKNNPESNISCLIDKPVNKESIIAGLKKFNENMAIREKDTIPWVSQPFVYPFPEVSLLDRCSEFNTWNSNMINGTPNKHSPLLNIIRTKFNNNNLKNPKTAWVFNEQDKERHSILLKSLMDKKNEYKINKTIESKDIWEKAKMDLNKATFSMKKRKVEVQTSKQYSIVTVTKNAWEKMKDDEYFNWINDDDKTYRKSFDPSGFDHNKFMDGLLHYLSAYCENDIRDFKLLDTVDGDDCKFFGTLNNDIINDFKSKIDNSSKMRIFQIAKFISILSYSLLHMSQNNLTGLDFMCSNMGFKNVMLIVRGGKKIFKTQRSRHFRLLMPCSRELFEILTLGKLNHSYTVVNSKDQDYIYTPWMSLHEVELHHGLTMIHSFTNFYCVNVDRLLKEDDLCMTNLIFPMCLAVHGRRLTEGTLHSIRYCLANAMGEFSSLDKMIPELAVIPKDHFQYSTFKRFSDNYFDYYTMLNDTEKTYYNVFTREKMKSEHSLSLMIYSTYLMAKSPTTQRLSQVTNLTKIMKAHDEFYKNTKGDCNYDKLDNYDIDDKENPSEFINEAKNFSFSSNGSFLVGKQLAKEMLIQNKVAEIHNDWFSSLNKSWVNISTSSGMRYRGQSFYGNKGNYVVAQELLQYYTSEDIEEIIRLSGENYSSKRIKRFKDFDLTYKKVISNMGDVELIFHCVDKVQRNLDREIYVMDVDTKTLQQPLESFFKKLCEKTDNELISVPSGKRLSKIHSKLFDKASSSLNHWIFATLDCTRWAPKSLILKYVWFVLGMADVMPVGFVRYFLAFFNKMMSKRIYINKNTYKAYINNSKNKSMDKYFIFDEDRQGSYYVEMPYSFMMGIFNYLSSLMHAYNISYMNEIIPMLLKRECLDTIFRALIDAHSDDSGGKFEARTKMSLLTGIKYYELGLMTCNHNLSHKKCTLSSYYFELLSILYVNKKLVPLIAKFISNLDYEPSNKGPSMDLINCISSSIESISMGCTLSEALLKKLLKADFICDFYKLKKRTDLPPHLMGYPISNPFLDLIAGSCSDVVRLYFYDQQRLVTLFSISEFTGPELCENGIKAVIARPKIKMKKRLLQQKVNLNYFLEPFFEKLKLMCGDRFDDFVTSLCQSKNKHCFVNLIKYNYLYNTNSYISSLMYDNMTRSVTRSMNFIHSECIAIGDTYVKPRDFHDILDKNVILYNSDYMAFKDLYKIDKKDPYFANINEIIKHALDINLSECNNFMRRLDYVDISDIKMTHFNATFKPVTIIHYNNQSGTYIENNYHDIHIYNDYPELAYLICPYKDLKRDNEILKSFIKSDNPSIVALIADKYFKYNVKEYFIYSQVNTEHRLVNTTEKMLTYMFENTFYKQEITKAVYDKFRLESSLFLLDKNNVIYYQSDIISKYKTWLFIKDYFKDNTLKSFEENDDYVKYVSGQETCDNLFHVVIKDHNMLNDLSKRQKIFDANDLKNLSIFYTWLKPQAKVGDDWVGSAIMIIKINHNKFMLHIEKNYITKMEVYGFMFGQLTLIEQSIFERIMMKYSCDYNFGPVINKGISFGRHCQTGKMGFFPGEQLISCVETIHMPNSIDFDLKVINRRILPRFPNDQLKIVFKACKRGFSDIRMYSPMDLFDYSKDLNSIITIKNFDAMANDDWFKVINKLVELKVDTKQLSSESMVNNFLSTDMCDITIKAENEMLDMEDEDDMIDEGTVEYVCCNLELKNGKPTVNDPLDKTDYFGLFKRHFVKQLENYGKSSLDTELKKEKLQSLLDTFNVDPSTLPDDIRSLYLNKVVDRKITENSEQLNDDFFDLMLNCTESKLEGFRLKWGDVGLQRAIVIYQPENLNVLISFEDLIKSSYLNDYKKIADYMILGFSRVFYNNSDRIIPKLEPLLLSRRNKFDKLTLTRYFTLSTLTPISIGRNNIAQLYFLESLNIMLNDTDLVLKLKDDFKQNDLDGFPKQMLKDMKFDASMKYKVLEFMASYMRYNNANVTLSVKEFKSAQRDYILNDTIDQHFNFGENIFRWLNQHRDCNPFNMPEPSDRAQYKPGIMQPDFRHKIMFYPDEEQEEDYDEACMEFEFDDTALDHLKDIVKNETVTLFSKNKMDQIDNIAPTDNDIISYFSENMLELTTPLVLENFKDYYVRGLMKVFLKHDGGKFGNKLILGDKLHYIFCSKWSMLPDNFQKYSYYDISDYIYRNHHEFSYYRHLGEYVKVDRNTISLNFFNADTDLSKSEMDLKFKLNNIIKGECTYDQALLLNSKENLKLLSRLGLYDDYNRFMIGFLTDKDIINLHKLNMEHKLKIVDPITLIKAQQRLNDNEKKAENNKKIVKPAFSIEKILDDISGINTLELNTFLNNIMKGSVKKMMQNDKNEMIGNLIKGGKPYSKLPMDMPLYKELKTLLSTSVSDLNNDIIKMNKYEMRLIESFILIIHKRLDESDRASYDSKHKLSKEDESNDYYLMTFLLFLLSCAVEDCSKPLGQMYNEFSMAQSEYVRTRTIVEKPDKKKRERLRGKVISKDYLKEFFNFEE